MNKRIGAKSLGVLNVAYLFVLIALFYLNYNKFDNKNWSAQLIVWVVICFVLNILYFVTHLIPLYDFRFVFIVLAYLFMFGRVFYAWQGIEYRASWWLQDSFSSEEMYHACAYALMALQASFVGFFVLQKNTQLQSIRLCSEDEIDPNRIRERRVLFRCGVAVLLFGLPSRLFIDLRSVYYSMQTGWYESAGGIVGLVDDLAFLFIPGVLLLLEGIKSTCAKKVLTFSTFAYYLAIMLLTGDRRYYISGLLALGCYYLARIKRKKNRVWTYIVIGFICLFVLNFIEIVRHNRYGNLSSIGEFFSKNALSLFDFSNTFDDVITEFGISFYSVVVAIANVPEVLLSYQFGKTFVFSLLSIVPFGGRLAGAASSPSDYINELVQLPVGATFYGDMYINFGFFFGMVFSMIIAHFLGRYFISKQAKNDSINYVLYFSGFYILINLVRASIYEVTRPFVWGILIITVVYRFFKRKMRL